MLNWKDINDKYPKAFLEWEESKKPKLPIVDFDGNEFKMSESSRYSYYNNEVYVMPHYFDTLGIRVGVAPCPITNGDWFDLCVLVSNGERWYYGPKQRWEKAIDSARVSVHDFWSFEGRQSALEAGVLKAFELREMQIKTDK